MPATEKLFWYYNETEGKDCPRCTIHELPREYRAPLEKLAPAEFLWIGDRAFIRRVS